MKNKFNIGDVVKLKLREDEWTGEIVEILNNVALVKLLHNMHYHAKLDELTKINDEQDQEKT
jgi:hypothetical protein